MKGVSFLSRSVLLSFTLGIVACGGGGAPSATTAQTPTPDLSPSPTPVPVPTPGSTPVSATRVPSFQNKTLESGLFYQWYPGENWADVEPRLVPWEIQFSAGLAAADFDNDNDIDIFVVGGFDKAGALYESQGDGTFEEITLESGLSFGELALNGPAFADIDGDQDLDIIVGSLSSELFIYRYSPAVGYELDENNDVLMLQSRFTFGSAFGDYDQDGDLDMLLSHWGSDYRGEYLWENDGTGGFTDQTGVFADLATISGPAGVTEPTFSPSFSDINNDGFADILFASDFSSSTSFVNDDGESFIDNTAALSLAGEAVFGMGSAVADYDNDGDLDWFITNIFSTTASGNKLLRNSGDGTFADVSFEAGIFDGGWGWGTCFADFNNDGLLDIFMTNGHFTGNSQGIGTVPFYEDPIKLFLANGDGTFDDVSIAAGLTDTGMGRAVLCYDFNDDGRIDIIVQNNNPSGNGMLVYENTIALANRNWLGVKLVGDDVNFQAVGARMWLDTPDGVTQMREVGLNNSFVSLPPTEQHFGLGANTEISEFRVQWPDGSETLLNDLQVNQQIQISIDD